jgi:predicted nucleic acid-binding protein
MPFVLDASVAVAWCFEDETTPYTEYVLALLGSDTAHVPAIWPLEVANALLVAERRKRLEPADTVRFLELLRTLPIMVDTSHGERVFGAVLEAARAYSVTSYDAAYLELAMREGLPLAAQDTRLTAAATAAGVSKVEPE